MNGNLFQSLLLLLMASVWNHFSLSLSLIT